MDKNYTTYSSEDFAADAAFQEWVKNGAAAERWEKWLVDHREMDTIVAEAKALIQAVEFKSFSLDQQRKKKMWEVIDEHTADSHPSMDRSRQKIIRLVSWASSVAAVLLLTWMVLKPGDVQEIYVEPRDSYVYALPDESTININADSKITYNKKQYAEKRVIELEGEAFFDVEKGNQFIVELDGAAVEVLGTSFNIFHRADSVSVQCYTGRVKVSMQGKEVILTPGEMVTFGKKDPVLVDQNFEMINLSPKWMNGVYEYQNQSLIYVLKEIERQYDVAIDYDAEQLKSISYSGGFENRMALDSTLETVCYPFSLEYEISGQKVKITK